MANKQKLLIITRSIDFGGEAIFIRKLKSGLNDKIYKVKILSFLKGDKKTLGKNTQDIYFLRPVWIFGKPFISLTDFRIIRREVTQNNCVVIHFLFDIHSVFYLLYSFVYCKRNIVTFHTDAIVPYQSKTKFFYYILIKFFSINLALLTSRKVIFLTKSQSESYRKLSILKHNFDNKVRIIPNFIEEKYIGGQKSILGDTINVLYIGPASIKKGFSDLLTLTREVSDENIKFTAVGISKSDLKRLDNFTNDIVELHEPVSYQKIFSFYDKSEILISLSYSEVFPISILEAMARGLVVLATDLPGTRELIKEGRNGYLFNRGDIMGAKKVLLYLLNNPTEIARISKNNLKDIYKYSQKRLIKKYESTFDEV